MAKTAQATKDEGAQASAPVPARKNVPAIVAFKNYLDERMDQLQFALPPHISPDRFARTVLTAVQRKAELLACTRQSLFNACLLAAQDGLLPDGREGAIVPYGENENGQKKADIATWMPMVEGLRKKARNSGGILNWEVHIVRARDKFHVALGDDARIVHEPYFGPDDPGAIVGAYSIAWLRDDAISRDVMTIRDIEKIKAKSRAKNGPWGDATFFPEMCKKTVARRHYKQLPHSSDLDKMIAHDDANFGLDERTEDAIEQRQARRLTSVGAALDTFGGTTIDHDPQPGEGAAAEAADDQAQAEADAAALDPKPDPKQAAKPKPTDQAKPTPQAKAEQDHPAGDAGMSKPQVRGDNEGGDEADADATDTADDEAWPEGKSPSNGEEYAAYARAVISGTLKPLGANAVINDGAALRTWFTSKAERDLRGKCSVIGEVYDAIAADARERIAELAKG